jgi:hypothetical protein
MYDGYSLELELHLNFFGKLWKELFLTPSPSRSPLPQATTQILPLGKMSDLFSKSNAGAGAAPGADPVDEPAAVPDLGPAPAKPANILEEIHTAHENCARLIKLIHGKPTIRKLHYRAVFGEPTDWSKAAGAQAHATTTGAAAGGAGGPAPKPVVTIQEMAEEVSTMDYINQSVTLLLFMHKLR